MCLSNTQKTQVDLQYFGKYGYHSPAFALGPRSCGGRAAVLWTLSHAEKKEGNTTNRHANNRPSNDTQTKNMNQRYNC